MKSLRFYMTTLFVALGFVLTEAIVFTAAVFVVAWTYNVVVVTRFQELPLLPFKLAIALGIFAGLINTGLNSFLNRKGRK